MLLGIIVKDPSGNLIFDGVIYVDSTDKIPVKYDRIEVIFFGGQCGIQYIEFGLAMRFAHSSCKLMVIKSKEDTVELHGLPTVQCELA